jgi:hypothetical protein
VDDTLKLIGTEITLQIVPYLIILQSLDLTIPTYRPSISIVSQVAFLSIWKSFL